MKKTIITLLAFFAVLFSGGLDSKAATLNVSHTSALSWSASYQVKTSGNRIVGVTSVKANAKVGKIEKKYITRDSSSKVTLHLTRSVGVIRYHVTLSAKVHDNKLIVTTN